MSVDPAAWVAWFLIGTAVPAEDLQAELDARGISAANAAEAVLRNGNSEGMVGCTPGHDWDAKERASLIAKRAIALAGRGPGVSGREVSNGGSYRQSTSSSGAGAHNGKWQSATVKLVTAAGGAETCVAFFVEQPKK